MWTFCFLRFHSISLNGIALCWDCSPGCAAVALLIGLTNYNTESHRLYFAITIVAGGKNNDN